MYKRRGLPSAGITEPSTSQQSQQPATNQNESRKHLVHSILYELLAHLLIDTKVILMCLIALATAAELPPIKIVKQSIETFDDGSYKQR
jgi:hypothetical protein